MRNAILVGIVVLMTVGLQPRTTRANGMPEMLDYDQPRRDTVVAIPDSTCGIFYEYAINGQPGDVVTITAERLSGNIEPVITIEGQESPASGATTVLENYVLPAGRDYYMFEVAGRNRTTGEFTVTVRLTGQQEVVAPDYVQSFTVGSRPVHSVWNGELLFVSNFASQNISVLDQQGQVINTFPFPGNPAAMQWDGSRLWIADRTGDSVYVFDPSGQQLAQYQVGFVPISMSYAEALDLIWIALYDDLQVVALDMDGKEIVRIDTPTNPSTILSDGTSLAWVTLYGTEDQPGNSVITVGTDGKIYEEYATDSLLYPDDLAWDGEHLYIAYGGSNRFRQVEVYGERINVFRISGGAIIDMVWDGEFLWLTLDSQEVVALSADDYFETDIARFPTEARPFGVTYAEPYIWVANRGTQNNPGSTIQRIDRAALFGE